MDEKVEVEEKTPTEAEAVKPKHKYLPVLITVLVMILVAAALAGGVWYYMDKKAKDKATEHTKEIETLKKQYETQTNKLTNDLKASTLNAESAAAKQIVYTDKEQIIVATIAKYNNPNYIPAVGVTKIEGNWALSSPLPLQFKADSGYSVAAMGGTTYLWNKVDGRWVYVGSASEGGWDSAVKARYKDIPTTIIPNADR